MPEKNLALIGAGYWGKNLVRSIGGHDAASCPPMLKTICDQSSAIRQQMAKDYPDTIVTDDSNAGIGGHDAASCPPIPHDEKYPVAERIARQGLYLPSGLTLTETQIDLICDTVKAILEN